MWLQNSELKVIMDCFNGASSSYFEEEPASRIGLKIEVRVRIPKKGKAADEEKG